MANVSDFMTDYNQMQADAGRIIQKRITMMLTGTMSAPEACEMVGEKMIAMADSFLGAMFASFTGDVTDVMAAALVPYREKTAINVRRLGV